ncbi:MAG: hypothetical protein JHC33_14750 [Ignisphaera sp.]|nr:hypothetical protein [Ignisphaera sp.]
MSTQLKYPSANAVVTTGWTSPTNAYANDTTNLATAQPAKSATINSDYSGFGFDGVLPSNANVSSVLIEAYVKQDTASANETFRFQPYVSGSPVGTEYTTTSLTTSLAIYSSTFTGISRANLLDANFKVRVGASRNSSGSTLYIVSMDYIRVTVTYTLGAPYSFACVV